MKGGRTNVKLQSNCSDQSERRCRQDHNGGQSGRELGKQGKKVLLVDADAQANLTMALGYTKTDNLPITLSDLMQNVIDGKSVDVPNSILRTDEGVDLLPSCVELAGIETTLIDAKNRDSVLKTCISEVKKNYDYVLIDCMPALGMLTINALAAADSVVIPNQPHYFSIKGLEQLLRSVSRVMRQINPNLRIDGILMKMVMPRTRITHSVISTWPMVVTSGYLIPFSIRAVEATAEEAFSLMTKLAQ